MEAPSPRWTAPSPECRTSLSGWRDPSRSIGYALAFLVSLILVTLPWEAAQAAGRQVALVIGNAAYENVSPLVNPKRDAAALSDRLRDAGFDVVEAFDADTFAMRRAADRFVDAAKGADLAVFYYAGHGVQLFDQNYLLARDTDPEALTEIQDLGLSLSDLADRLRESGAVRVALLVDACRDNPLPMDTTVRLVTGAGASASEDEGGARPAVALATGRGLAPLAAASGPGGAQMLTFFAAQPREVSYDGTGSNSFLMEGLLEALSGDRRDMAEVIRHASAYVRTVTGGRQVPQVVSDWTGDVALGGNVKARVEYDLFDRESTLSRADRDLVRKGTAGFSKLRGDFVAQAGWNQGTPDNLSEDERKRYRSVGGNAPSMSVHYDLDRDGREETLTVYNEVSSVQVVLEKEGVRRTVGSCGLPAPIDAIEFGLRDVDGDRRPEVFVTYEGERTAGFGRLCVLRFRGFDDLAGSRRGNLGRTDGNDDLFDTLLDTDAGWSATVAIDGTIRRCSGTGCADAYDYRFDGRRYVSVEDASVVPNVEVDSPTSDDRSSPEAPSVEQRVATFVNATLFRPGKHAGSELRVLYGERVDYFGKSNRSAADVVKEKLQYFERWPKRTFVMDETTLTVTPDRDALTVRFEYSYEVSGAKGTRAGRGLATMRLRENVGRSFVILSEGGRTL
nr:caspase family protein [Aureimonas jatrophae]